jgi:hypothetical protein
MGSLTPLVAAGTDAYSNLFDVEITFPTSVVKVTSLGQLDASVRISDFKPPEFKQSQYKIEYKGVSITKLGPKIEGERTFDIPYRIDADYDLHLRLMQWKHIYMDPSGDGVINYNIVMAEGDIANFGSVSVKAYNPSSSLTTSALGGTGTGRVAEEWKFTTVMCVEAGVPAFSREIGEPNKASAKFVFLRMTEPGQKLAPKANDPFLTV